LVGRRSPVRLKVVSLAEALRTGSLPAL